MDNRSDLPREKTKICPLCGVRKPISDFLVNPLDLIKKYDDLCHACRSRGTRPWEKKFSKNPDEGDDDEGGSGGKTRSNTINYYAKLLSKQLQTLNAAQSEFEKQNYREELTEEKKVRFEKTVKDKASKEKGKSAKATSTTKADSKADAHAKPASTAPSSSAQAKGFFIPAQTGTLMPWADMFRWFINFSFMMGNPSILFYNMAVQANFLTRFSPLTKIAAPLATPASPILNSTYLAASSEKSSLFQNAKAPIVESHPKPQDTNQQLKSHT